ncbi:MAG: type II toxin-antitoxin system VapC family toxin [Geminicoccaceae bacterium]
MILVDVNLLIYAIDSDSPQHARARPWLERVLSDTAPVGLPWIVVLAFIRITTREGIMRRPLAPTAALAHVDSWLRQPCVEVIAPGARHWPILRRLLEATGSAGNLTSDAHIAALALERGASVCSTDHDFARFPGIRHVNPLAAG